MSAPQADGASLREHYEALAERTGRSIAEIAGTPEIPEGCEMLWRDFTALSVARGSNGFSASRLTWLDIDAYQRVHGFRFEAWEIEAIRRMDMAFVAEAEKRKPSS